jgi:hypothetical protein
MFQVILNSGFAVNRRRFLEIADCAGNARGEARSKTKQNREPLASKSLRIY